MEKDNKKITSRDVDFAKWYTDVVSAAHLASYTSVKGCIAIEPNGYAIWEKMQEILDKKFKELGHVNVQMPLLIPENLLKKESELVEGFAPEVAWVTHGGSKELEEKLCIRPTSETMFCDYYKDVVKSYRDLPKLYNQWCNVLRWEKETRPFLRSREFLWQEGHTMHRTEDEAREETIKMFNIYKKFQEEYLALPVITGKKTDKEKFAGAEETYTIEAMMYDGYALQNGTSHYFGKHFAEVFGIKFIDQDNKYKTPYQTSWGVTTRMIGSIIMTHGDDNGLVLPPKIAPFKVIIIPIGDVSSKLEELENNFKLAGITYKVDNSNKTPGFKFAEAEVKGYPIRIELGARDLKEGNVTLVRRDTLEKIVIKYENIVSNVNELLESIQKDMFNRAKARRDSMIYEANNYKELTDIAKNKSGFIKINWCGNQECEDKIKNDFGIKSRCLIDDEEVTGPCTVCGSNAKNRLYVGRQY